MASFPSFDSFRYLPQGDLLIKRKHLFVESLAFTHLPAFYPFCSPFVPLYYGRLRLSAGVPIPERFGSALSPSKWSLPLLPPQLVNGHVSDNRHIPLSDPLHFNWSSPFFFFVFNLFSFHPNPLFVFLYSRPVNLKRVTSLSERDRSVIVFLSNSL